MARLGVNIDHVATVRQARHGVEPDPVWAAVEAELGGADLITVHLREDRRHIQDRDVELLRQTVNVPLNLEMAAVDEIIAIALRLKPNMVTLVPEKRSEITTEGGLDVAATPSKMADVVSRLTAGCSNGGFNHMFMFHIGQSRRFAGCADRNNSLHLMVSLKFDLLFKRRRIERIVAKGSNQGRIGALKHLDAPLRI